jgi:hypothetical protein
MSLGIKKARLALASSAIIALAASACPRGEPATNPQNAQAAATSPLPPASVEVSRVGAATGAAGDTGRESDEARRRRGFEKFKAEPIDQAWASQTTKDLEAALNAHGAKFFSIECRRSTCLVHAEESEPFGKTPRDPIFRASDDLRRKGYPGGLSGSSEAMDGGGKITVYWFSFVR